MKMNILFGVLVVLVLLLVALRLYGNRSYGFEGFAGEGPTVMIFKADWCGHCKKAAPEFQKLAAGPLALSGGRSATVKILDADADKEEMKKYNVRGFPTIMIMNGSDTTEYPGERTYDGVLEFLNKM
jgi:thiol-disulfide isomerase/thioredoxin|uniref:Thioredoxin domain-containing protein n=1 Tax=viral metagenome TaxID=1070528 RepID=A0A6C0DET8_9ZZZZ